MTRKDDGGPTQQMTIRQYYIGQALVGGIASMGISSDPSHLKRLAEMCFMAADAVIEVEKKEIQAHGPK